MLSKSSDSDSPWHFNYKDFLEYIVEYYFLLFIFEVAFRFDIFWESETALAFGIYII